MNLGDRVKFRTTGVVGVVAARAVYADGSTPQVRVEYQNANGSHMEDWTPETAVEFVGAQGIGPREG